MKVYTKNKYFNRFVEALTGKLTVTVVILRILFFVAYFLAALAHWDHYMDPAILMERFGDIESWLAELEEAADRMRFPKPPKNKL